MLKSFHSGSPQQFHNGAIAQHTERGWAVHCLSCRVYIGTMTGETLSRAVQRTAGRGGVLCPDCRRMMCDACNGLVADGKRIKVLPNGKRLCTVCLLDSTGE